MPCDEGERVGRQRGKGGVGVEDDAGEVFRPQMNGGRGGGEVKVELGGCPGEGRGRSRSGNLVKPEGGRAGKDFAGGSVDADFGTFGKVEVSGAGSDQR
jgi:hypothetical protein